MRARALVVSALLGAFVLGAAAPASAHISAFSGDFTYSLPNDEGVARGEITCTAGETFVISVRVMQKEPGSRGFGETTGTCTGSSQEWSLRWTEVSGDLVGGRTRLMFTAKTFDSGTVDDKEQFSRVGLL